MLPGTRPALVAIALLSVTACGGGSDTPPPATPSPATHFLVTAPSTGYTRASLPIAVTALDAFNKPTTNYEGSVLITSSDGKALLPGVAVAIHSGGGRFNATLESVGTQTLTATDSVYASVAGTSAPITVSTAPGIAITSGPPPGGVVGSGYSPHRGGPCTYACPTVYYFPLAASGGVGNFTWMWAAAPGSSLPAGLSIAGDVIRGTPPIGSIGVYKVIVTATDGGTPAVQASTDYTISIVNPPLPIIATQPGPPGATLNQPYSYQFQVSGSGPVVSETGALPPGLAPLTAAGVLAGTPTTANLYPITVRAVDQAGQDASQAFTIGVFQHGFTPTGGLPGIRTLHTATLLASGQVLVAGGSSNDGATTWLRSSELFTPASGSFVASGSMQIARSYHTATLLCDLTALPCTNSKVLIVGGEAGTGAIRSAELYDPATGTFTLAVGSLGTARYGHTATRLHSGKVLIAGGSRQRRAVRPGHRHLQRHGHADDQHPLLSHRDAASRRQGTYRRRWVWWHDSRLGRDFRSRHPGLQQGPEPDDGGPRRAYGDIAAGRQGADRGRAGLELRRCPVRGAL